MAIHDAAQAEQRSNGIGEVDLYSQDESLEPIAIIGASCRLPGGVHNLEQLWELLRDGRSAWRETPADRFNQGGFHWADGEGKHGTTNANGGHFLDQDIAAFDAAFFGILPAEANAMDPQQRLLLEIAYECFESAGLTLDQLSDSSTGVYVGQWASDYHEILTRDLDYPPTYLISGTGAAISSNRISYFFNLKGPSFTLDTGCSASLVALHQAVQSIRAGETEQCFVGGVNLILDPQHYAYQSKLKMFSNEGKSFPFDSRANGYGRGEGCCGVVLQPLSLAQKQGRPIRAIIRNSAVNQDGFTSGLTVPSSAAQVAAIRRAYAEAGLAARADYVEAHGTGTRTGDPIEAKAIAEALSSEQILPIGSIKGNIGHTESAAGLAGLLKALLMLEHGAVPPQVNSVRPNPAIPLKRLNLRMPQELEYRNLKRISVNSFGYGGTNAHVIVDSAASFLKPDKRTLVTNGADSGSHYHGNGSSQHLGKNDGLNRNGLGADDCERSLRPRLFVMSAATERSCQSMAASLADYLNDKSDNNSLLDQLAYTLSRRSVFSYRFGFVSSTTDDLQSQLREASTQPLTPTTDTGVRRIAFVFSGQGAQYPQMARELIGTWSIFTASLERAAASLKSLGSSWDLIQELSKPNGTSRVEAPEIAQPLSTAVQLALVDTLSDLGVRPTSVCGHSSGEIAAAYCADILSFDDAMAVSFHRGRLAGALLAKLTDEPGGMLAVGSSSTVVGEFIQQLGDVGRRLKIACFNSPSSVTVSGDSSAIDKLQVELEEAKIFNRKLRTGGAAYHSKQMKLIASDYSTALENVKPARGGRSITMTSSVTGKDLKDEEIDRDYWVQNLISPVLFEQAVTNMCVAPSGRKKIDLVLELGPHHQLSGPVKQTLRTLGSDVSKIACIGTLKRGEDAEVCMLNTLRSLYVQKCMVRLHEVKAGRSAPPRLLPDLPSYAFDNSETYWHESRLSKAYRNREHLPHEILGCISPENNGVEPQWRCYLRLDDVPWLQGHVVQGEVVFPAAGFISLAVEAAQRDAVAKSKTTSNSAFRLRNVSISQALVLARGTDNVELLVKLRPQSYSARKSSDTWQEFRILTVTGSEVWTEHCRGLVCVAPKVEGNQGPTTRSLTCNQLPNGRKTNSRKFYYLAQDAGFSWNSPFDGIVGLETNNDHSIAQVAPVSPEHFSSRSPYVIHPALLDSCLFQSLYAVLLLENNVNSPVVPTFIKSLTISALEQGTQLTNLACHAARTRDFLTFDVTVSHGSDNKVVISAEGITATRLPSLSTVAHTQRELCHTIDLVAYMSPGRSTWLQNACQSTVDRVSIVSQHEKLNALALSYMKPAFANITREHVPDGHLRYWFDWMQTCVTREYDPTILSSALEDETVRGRALKRIGPHLDELLRGSMHSLSLLTEGDLLSEIYTDERCQRCYRQVARYCAELGREHPGLKVLEIGGGTASASLPILNALRSNGLALVSCYDFTDISSAFFSAAGTKLQEFQDVVDFKTLNIENDPIPQGFELGGYDVIIAANVIHATSSIDRSIEHVRSLLRPGGRFILMEVTQDLLYLNLVFGTLSGWWAGYGEGRRLSPLQSEKEWASRLHKYGFEDTKPMFRDHELEDGGTQCVFIAHARRDLTPVSQGGLDIITMPGDSQAEFHDLLSARIQEVGKSFPTTAQEHKTSIVLQATCALDKERFAEFKQQISNSKVVLFIASVIKGMDQIPLTGDWIAGFCRTLRLEHTDIRFVSLLLDGELDSSKVEAVMTILQSPSMNLDISGGDLDLEFVERNGQMFVPRVSPLRSMTQHIHGSMGQLPPIDTPLIGDRSMVLELETSGLIETMRYIDDVEAPSQLDADHVKLQLCSASVNFKEVLIASGQLEGITNMVNDCSGIVLQVGENMRERYQPGDRVCALGIKSYANYPVVHGDLIHRIPDSMDFDTAAAIPVVWVTVYYGLIDCGRLKKGDRILIHSAAGAVGQAAIILARHIGAEIYATCGSDSKKNLLMEEFGVPSDHIFSSRTTAFHGGIMALTLGQGVDVVLNSLSGELLRESCNILAPFGRFVEIGRKDLMEDVLLPMEFMLNNITFSYVDMAQIAATRRQLSQRLLGDVMGLFAAGSVTSVILTKMPISQMSEAFRHLQSGNHVGKVVLTVESNQQVKAVPPRPQLPELEANATYIITGGLGGLGKRILSWLAERGARNIVTISRSGAIDSESEALIKQLRSAGVNVSAKRCDVASASSLSQTLSAVTVEMPPIRGLIQSAMVLNDSLFTDMNAEQWSAAISPKVQGSWNLHALLPSELDFFIMLSSGVAVTGNVGQSNYSAACSFQDGLARHRSQLGLKGHSINVGAIADAGFVSENPEVAIALRRKGLGTITTKELISHLDQVVAMERRPADQDKVCQTIIGLQPAGDEPGLGQGEWMNDKKFSLLGLRAANQTQASQTSVDVGAALRAALDLDEAIDVACRAIIDQLGKIVGLPSESVHAVKSLSSYGVDSLVAVELRNWINIQLKANLSLLTVRNTISIGSLAELVARESKLVRSEVR